MKNLVSPKTGNPVTQNMYNKKLDVIQDVYSQMYSHSFSRFFGDYSKKDKEGNRIGGWEGMHLLINRREDGNGIKRVKNVSQVIINTPRHIYNNTILISYYALYHHKSSGWVCLSEDIRNSITQDLYEDVNNALTALGLPNVTLNPNEKIERCNIFELSFDYSKIEESSRTLAKVCEVINDVYVNLGYRDLILEYIYGINNY